MKTAFACLLFMTMTFVAACGDDDDAPHPSADAGPVLPADQQAYCDLLHTACARQLECGAVVVSQATDLDACADVATCAAVLDAAEAAGGHIRVDNVATCRTAVEAASCQSLANTKMAEAAPACAAVLEGPGALGDECHGGLLNGGCQAGLVCDQADGSCPSTCQPAEAIACVGLDCPDGQFCNFGECKPRAAAGAPCELGSLDEPWDRPCVDGYRCVLADSGATSCEPELAAGSECVYSNAWECVDGFACIDGTCAAARAAGEECSTYSECAPGLMCDYTATPAVCATPAAAGQPCSDGVGACAAGLACEGGICAEPTPEPPPPQRPLLAPGASCGEGGICPLGQSCRCDDAVTCSAMHCAAGPALGESCAPVMITTPQGSFTAEDAFNPYACREGLCDLWGGYRCVEPHAPGDECSYAAPTLTLECVTLVCRDHACVGFADLFCAE